MVEISLSGSGEGPEWETAPGYSTTLYPKYRAPSEGGQEGSNLTNCR